MTTQTKKKVNLQKKGFCKSKIDSDRVCTYCSLNSTVTHQELQAIIADSNDALVVYDKNKKILQWNKGARNLYGYTQKEARTLHYIDLVARAYVRENKELFQNITDGIPVKLFETKHRTKQGALIDVWVSISCLDVYYGNEKTFVMTVRDFTEDKQLIVKNQFLAQEIIRVQERERRRIAEDIHDDLGQSLVALKMFFLAHAVDVLKANPVLGGKVTEIQNNIDDIIEKARRLSHELLPPTFKYIGISRAIQGLVQTFSKHKKISIVFRHRNIQKVRMGEREIVLYRIIQESLNNIMKHAEATRVKINLSHNERATTLRIEDNGKGLTQFSRKRGLHGVGISIMRERARLINADFSISSKSSKGTRIIVTLPNQERKQK